MSTGNQPKRIVIEAAADVVVALLGQGLILVIAAAVAELRRGDVAIIRRRIVLRMTP